MSHDVAADRDLHDYEFISSLPWSLSVKSDVVRGFHVLRAAQDSRIWLRTVSSFIDSLSQAAVQLTPSEQCLLDSAVAAVFVLAIKRRSNNSEFPAELRYSATLVAVTRVLVFLTVASAFADPNDIVSVTLTPPNGSTVAQAIRVELSRIRSIDTNLSCIQVDAPSKSSFSPIPHDLVALTLLPSPAASASPPSSLRSRSSSESSSSAQLSASPQALSSSGGIPTAALNATGNASAAPALAAPAEIASVDTSSKLLLPRCLVIGRPQAPTKEQVASAYRQLGGEFAVGPDESRMMPLEEFGQFMFKCFGHFEQSIVSCGEFVAHDAHSASTTGGMSGGAVVAIHSEKICLIGIHLRRTKPHTELGPVSYFVPISEEIVQAVRSEAPKRGVCVIQ